MKATKKAHLITITAFGTTTQEVFQGTRSEAIAHAEAQVAPIEWAHYTEHGMDPDIHVVEFDSSITHSSMTNWEFGSLIALAMLLMVVAWISDPSHVHSLAVLPVLACIRRDPMHSPTDRGGSGVDDVKRVEVLPHYVLADDGFLTFHGELVSDASSHALHDSTLIGVAEVNEADFLRPMYDAVASYGERNDGFAMNVPMTEDAFRRLMRAVTHSKRLITALEGLGDVLGSFTSTEGEEASEPSGKHIVLGCDCCPKGAEQMYLHDDTGRRKGMIAKLSTDRLSVRLESDRLGNVTVDLDCPMARDVVRSHMKHYGQEAIGLFVQQPTNDKITEVLNSLEFEAMDESEDVIHELVDGWRHVEGHVDAHLFLLALGYEAESLMGLWIDTATGYHEFGVEGNTVAVA